MSQNIEQQANLVFIALGSNLEEPITHIQQAYDELTELPSTHFLKHSSLYKTAPIGRLDQPDFVNSVVQIETKLTPHSLLIALLEIEHRHGRIRESLNAPRTLDLDILMYSNLQYIGPGLTLPHPRMHKRAFVLQPLMEIYPDCYIPGHGTVTKLLSACLEQEIEQMSKVIIMDISKNSAL